METATPRSGPGKYLTLVGSISVLPKIAEARRFTTVVLSCSLQKNNPKIHSVFPYTVLQVSTLKNMCLRRLMTRCKSINKRSCVSWTRILHQSSNIAYFSVVNFETFVVYIYKLQPV